MGVELRKLDTDDFPGLRDVVRRGSTLRGIFRDGDFCPRDFRALGLQGPILRERGKRGGIGGFGSGTAETLQGRGPCAALLLG